MGNNTIPGNFSPAWFLSGCTLVALAIGVAGYLLVSPGAPVAMHFGIGGDANGWASPGRAFFTAPAICAGLVLLQAALPSVKPSTDRLERKIVSRVLGAVAIVLVAAQTYVFVQAL